MSLLYRIIYAAHAKGTHHKLALDALAHLEGPDAGRWRRLFLKHADTYLAGAKAPDDVFKDFKNHVLHPRDGFWGGAPRAARHWYDKTVSALVAGSWPDAVNAAGILSHYVTDAVHPFHTGQSEAESAIHRAFEWSTAKSYEALKAAAGSDGAAEVSVPGRPDWLEEMLRAGAVRANAHYETLIAHYDIHRGVVDPPAGLDAVAQRIVGDLILHASRLFGLVLGRALAEAQVAPPEVSLTVETVLATLQIPIKTLAKRFADKADRQQVERMYDEFKSTGTVEVNLPEDDRMIRELFQAEVQGAVPNALAARPVPRIDPLSRLPAFVTLAQRLAEGIPAAHGLAQSASAAGEPDVLSSLQSRPVSRSNVSSIGVRAEPSRSARPRLQPSAAVVEAPSIGPRMAERLWPLGVRTVHDLLAADPAALAKALQVSDVSAATVADWQAQAQLVCLVPGLSGTGAQLLVGAGYRDVGAIAMIEPDKLSADLLAFAATDTGRRILRDGGPPDVARIKFWAEGARTAAAA
jgi:predicted flap endonuclease-1-like 5' DNA nuclease